MSAEPQAQAPVHRRRVLVTVLLTLAVVIGFVAMLATWVNRQALNTDAWTKTSGQLLENKQVQTAVSAYMVDQLFSSVDVAAELQKVLPPQAAGLAGPAAGGLQEIAGRLAPRLLASPKVQEAWRTANRTAHAELIKLIDGGGAVLTTTNGNVVLNLRPLVDQLAARLGVENQVASVRSKLQGSTGATARGVAQQKLGITLPPQSGQIVLMRSNELRTVQDVAKAIRDLAVVLTALALILFALAVWLAAGWRRIALRSAGWCFVGLGLTVLLLRRVVGNRVVDSLVNSDTVKPAAHDAWTIGTTLLYDIAIAMFAYGVILVVAAWVAGHTRPAVELRRDLAPALRYHVASVYGVVALLFLLLLAWGPTPATRKPLGILLFAALIVLAVELLRRQVAREYPDVQPGATGERMRAWAGGTRDRMRSRGSRGGSQSQPAPTTGSVDELERLAALHDRGVVDDEEFATQKTLILGRS